jgi:hypothetical protein
MSKTKAQTAEIWKHPKALVPFPKSGTRKADTGVKAGEKKASSIRFTKAPPIPAKKTPAQIWKEQEQEQQQQQQERFHSMCVQFQDLTVATDSKSFSINANTSIEEKTERHGDIVVRAQPPLSLLTSQIAVSQDTTTLSKSEDAVQITKPDVNLNIDSKETSVDPAAKAASQKEVSNPKEITPSTLLPPPVTVNLFRVPAATQPQEQLIRDHCSQEQLIRDHCSQEQLRPQNQTFPCAVLATQEPCTKTNPIKKSGFYIPPENNRDLWHCPYGDCGEVFEIPPADFACKIFRCGWMRKTGATAREKIQPHLPETEWKVYEANGWITDGCGRPFEFKDGKMQPCEWK